MVAAPDARVVYVVDADASVRHALARLLEAAGLEARPCESVAAFLARHADDGSACVVLDIADPAREPAGWATRLRREATDVAIIAVSASDGDSARRTARDLGAKAFFRKPVDGAALLDSISWVTQEGSDRARR